MTKILTAAAVVAASLGLASTTRGLASRLKARLAEVPRARQL